MSKMDDKIKMMKASNTSASNAQKEAARYVFNTWAVEKRGKDFVWRIFYFHKIKKKCQKKLFRFKTLKSKKLFRLSKLYKKIL